MKTEASPYKDEFTLLSYRAPVQEQEFDQSINPYILKTEDLRQTGRILDEIASPEPPREPILLS
jgi:hypothetical protein